MINPTEESATNHAHDIAQDPLSEWDRQHVWHAFTQMAEYEPFIVERAEGCELIDTAGNRYLDGVSSLWCNVHGHRHPRLDSAIRAQLDQVAHVTSLGMSNPTSIRLAKRLAALSPQGLEHVFFSSDGASSVEVALKMAFQYWQQRDDPKPEKTKYIAYEGAYHGDTLGAVSVGGVPQFHQMFSPLLFEVERLPVPGTYRTPEGISRENLADGYLYQLDLLLQQEHSHIAALIIEPLMHCAAGMVTQPAGYLRGVRELTQTYDVLLIADEVAVGVGRTGKMFACEHENVAPDFLCVAKGITGGYLPLAATLTTTEIWNSFLGSYTDLKSFFHGHTYGGNPLAAAVALASLDIFEEEQTLESLAPKIDRLQEHLARIGRLAHVGDVRQTGFIAGIELVVDKTTLQPFDWTERRGQQVCDYALKQGVWLRPLGNVVVIMPPLSITIEQLDRICQVVETGIRDLM